ncbi:MAG: DUF3179 domain-containing (seleno)protein [Pirellulaceae bacterium]
MNEIDSSTFVSMIKWSLLFVALLAGCQRSDGNSTADASATKGSFLENPDCFYRNYDHVFALNGPEAVPADAAELTDESEVLGICVDGVARAYWIPAMYHHHLANDMLGDTPVVVTYCGHYSCGSAYLATVNEEPQVFGIAGAWQGMLLLYDEATRSEWLQGSGHSIRGDFSGQQLERLPVVHTTWKRWKEAYPETSVVLGNPNDPRYPADTQAKRGDAEKSPALARTVHMKDGQLPPTEMVFGIAMGCDAEQGGPVAKAYSLAKLAAGPAVTTDQIGSLPVVLFYDAESNSAVGFQRTIGDETLEFEPRGESHFASSDGSVFDWLGRCIAGKYAGQQLPQLPGYQSEWLGWLVTCPETELVK